MWKLVFYHIKIIMILKIPDRPFFLGRHTGDGAYGPFASRSRMETGYITKKYAFYPYFAPKINIQLYADYSEYP